MLPDNIAPFVAEKDPGKLDAVKAALVNQSDLVGNLERLGSHWRIKVQFSEPVRIRINRRKFVERTVHTFAGFFRGRRDGSFAYATRRGKYGSLHGYAAYGIIDKVVRYSLVEPKKVQGFRGGRDQFARRFDRRFITEAAIDNLWTKKSSQHGGEYRPSDFRPVGPKGVRVVHNFIEKFAGIDAPPNEYYREGFEGKVHTLDVYENANGPSGRDIRICHRVGVPYVWYSSEYPGSGNGRYGLLVNEKTYLWLEDD